VESLGAWAARCCDWLGPAAAQGGASMQTCRVESLGAWAARCCDWLGPAAAQGGASMQTCRVESLGAWAARCCGWLGPAAAQGGAAAVYHHSLRHNRAMPGVGHLSRISERRAASFGSCFHDLPACDGGHEPPPPVCWRPAELLHLHFRILRFASVRAVQRQQPWDAVRNAAFVRCSTAMMMMMA
jgi:hypothetical protein